MGNRAPRQCRWVKADGTPCQANALLGSDYCFFHDPDKAGEREAAQRAGGRVGKVAALPPDTPDASLSSMADVVTFLGRTINQVRRGELDPKVANAVGYLAATLLRALEQGDIEKRLAELEAVVKGQHASAAPADADSDDMGVEFWPPETQP